MQEVKNPLVGIITGSASDKPIVDKVTGILDEFGVAWEYNVLSAHRTPNKTAKYVERIELPNNTHYGITCHVDLTALLKLA